MPTAFALRSPAFEGDEPIPSRHTCDGKDLSPPLVWSGAPDDTKAFAIIVDDPDAPDPAAPKRVWVHWIRYNISGDATGMAEGAGNRTPEHGARDALTDASASGYHGPCPPIGRHRYFFRLFALGRELPDLGPQARRKDVERAMEGHVVATAVLMGTYDRDHGRR